MYDYGAQHIASSSPPRSLPLTLECHLRHYWPRVSFSSRSISDLALPESTRPSGTG